MTPLQPDRLHACSQWIEQTSDILTSSQSIDQLIGYGLKLTASLAYVNGQMAQAKLELNKAKEAAYDALISAGKAGSLTKSPMLARDYISAKVANEQYAYDLAERCSRTIVHTMDTLRTCISALKEEMRNVNF